MYDYLIAGAGLYGAVCARELSRQGRRCLVVERRDHIGGNAYTREVCGIQVHQYGAHIFHTSRKEIWDYVQQFGGFVPFVNSPMADCGDGFYNLPFNMNTFAKLWNITTPAQARAILREQTAPWAGITPENLEEQALSQVGPELYGRFIRGYTEKQWGRPCRELPAFILRRIPCRFTYDNNYFSDPWQGIPKDGYTALVEAMLEGVQVELCTDCLDLLKQQPGLAREVIYTGCIDEFFGFSLGPLQYRSLRFEFQILEEENHQGVAVVNDPRLEIPYTRTIEHRHFMPGDQKCTVITREYPAPWAPGLEPFYPVNDPKNNSLCRRYQALAEDLPRVHFGGRLGLYRYLNMDQTIAAALAFARDQT